MPSPLLTDANMNAFPDHSISEYEPCTLTNSEQRLYKAIINSWNERLRQQRFEAYIAMEKEAQAVDISCRAYDQLANDPEKQAALKLRGSNEEDGDLRNHEVSGTAAHFAREMDLKPRRAAAEERRQGQKRKRDKERSEWSKRHKITELFSNSCFDLWADIRNHTRGDEIRRIQATISRCEQRKVEKMNHKREVIWKTYKRIPHSLIIKGSWRKLRRPPGYPIRQDLPHTGAGGTSQKVNVKNNREHPPTSSTQSDDAKSRANITSHNAINHPSASAAQSKRKAGSLGNASQTATNRTPAPSAQSKVGGSSVKDTSSPVTMVEDGSRKVTKVHDLLN